MSKGGADDPDVGRPGAAPPGCPGAALPVRPGAAPPGCPGAALPERPLAALPVVGHGAPAEPLAPAPPAAWHRAATRTEVEAARGMRVKLAERWVALIWWRERVHAIDDRCPHRGSSLAVGIVEHDGYVACLDHGWEYSLVSGHGRVGYEGCAQVFEVEDREGEVWVKVAPRPMPAWAEGWPDEDG